MRTLEWWAATNSIERRTWSDHGDTPTILWIAVSAPTLPAIDAMRERSSLCVPGIRWTGRHGWQIRPPMRRNPMEKPL
jgi:hypothetical protein